MTYSNTGKIDILNEDFHVPKSLSFQYVWATINTEESNISFWYQATKKAPGELVKTQPYKLREPVKNRIPASKLCFKSADDVVKRAMKLVVRSS